MCSQIASGVLRDKVGDSPPNEEKLVPSLKVAQEAHQRTKQYSITRRLIIVRDRTISAVITPHKNYIIKILMIYNKKNKNYIT